MRTRWVPPDRFWPWDAVLVAAWLAFSHWRPQEAYPEFRALGTGVLVCAALLRATVAQRRGSITWGVLGAALAFSALPLTGWVATARSLCAPAGTVGLGTWLQGMLIALWAFLACASRPEGAETLVRRGLLGLGLLALALSVWGFWDHWAVRPQLIEILEMELRQEPRDELTGALLHNVREGRLRSTLGDPNHLGFITAAGVIALLAGALWERRRGWRVAWALGAAATLVALLMSGSRGAVLSVLAGLGVLGGAAALKPGVHGKRVLVLAGASALVLAAVLAGMALLGPSAWIRRLGNMATVQERLGYWGIAWRLFLQQPLLGAGVGGFGVWYPTLRPAGLGTAQFAHNLPLQLMAETGLVGLLSALAPGLLLLRAHRPSTAAPPPPTTAALIAVFTAIGLNALVQYSIHFRELWVDTLLLLGLWAGWVRSGPPPGRPPSRWFAVLAAMAPLAALCVIWPPELRRAKAEPLDGAAEAALRAGEVARALELNSLLLAQEPGFDQWWVGAANRLLVLAEALPARREALLAEAENALAHAERLNSRRPSTHASRARLAALRGDLAGAVAAQRQAVALHPAEPLHRSQLARYLLQMGKAEEAETEARQALALNEGNFDALDVLSEALLAQGEWEEARRRATAMVDVDARRPEGWHLLARAAEAGGDREAALRAAEEALRRDPRNSALADHLRHLRDGP